MAMRRSLEQGRSEAEYKTRTPHYMRVISLAGPVDKHYGYVIDVNS